MTLDVLPEALADTQEAFNRLLEDNPTSASRFLDILDRAYDLIERNPNVGRPSKTRNIREWSVRDWPYIIPYRVVGDDVEVLRVWHTRRDKPEVW